MKRACMRGERTLEVSGGRINLAHLRGAVRCWVLFGEPGQTAVRLFASEDDAKKAAPGAKAQPLELDDQGAFELPKPFMDGLGEGEAVVLMGMGSFIDVVREAPLRGEQEGILSADWLF